jgi:hypothetical protein
MTAAAAEGFVEVADTAALTWVVAGTATVSPMATGAYGVWLLDHVESFRWGGATPLASLSY